MEASASASASAKELGIGPDKPILPRDQDLANTINSNPLEEKKGPDLLIPDSSVNKIYGDIKITKVSFDMEKYGSTSERSRNIIITVRTYISQDPKTNDITYRTQITERDRRYGQSCSHEYHRDAIECHNHHVDMLLEHNDLYHVAIRCVCIKAPDTHPFYCNIYEMMCLHSSYYPIKINLEKLKEDYKADPDMKSKILYELENVIKDIKIIELTENHA